MAVNKTQPTQASVAAYIAALPSAARQAEAHALVALYGQITGQGPQMYGPSIIGFGLYSYVYASGHKGVAPRAAFAPRKDKLVFYVSEGYELPADLLARLGKHKMSKGCLYLNKLADADADVLRQLLVWAYEENLRRWPTEA